MSEINSHRDLVAWQKAMDLGLLIYRLTASLPDHERFGLISQLRRASVSVASNIAEGYGRGSTQDYLRFLRVARGGLFEIDTQCLFALRLSYITQAAHEEANKRIHECGKILQGLIRSIEGNQN
ncbi:MAG: four helix bundle protein [Phycisphaerales bacterium]|nr:four helix bundle protein [Phycisphaerales bacterium]